MKTEIIYENKDLMVVYKPAGIATQTSKIGEKDVVSELKNYLKGGFLGVIHRLDQPVEGLLVFAKNPATAGMLSAKVREKGKSDEDSSLNKDYLAVVYGKPKNDKGRLENLMLKNSERRAEIIDGDDAEGLKESIKESFKESLSEAKKAVLDYECIESRIYKAMGIDGEQEYQLSLLRVHLVTGRFHQIRAQLAYMGCPIIGDRKYGTEDTIMCSDALRVRNVSLCADRLTFTGRDGKLMVYSHRPMGKLFAEFDIQY